MSRYDRLLRQANFPSSLDGSHREEYFNFILSNVRFDADEAIKQGVTKKLGNIRFRDILFETIKLCTTLPNGIEDLPGFVIGLWEYISKLNKYAEIKLPDNEAIVVCYAAVMYRDDNVWPFPEALLGRLPKSLTLEAIGEACKKLESLGCIKNTDGRIEVVEEIDILRD